MNKICVDKGKTNELQKQNVIQSQSFNTEFNRLKAKSKKKYCKEYTLLELIFKIIILLLPSKTSIVVYLIPLLVDEIISYISIKHFYYRGIIIDAITKYKDKNLLYGSSIKYSLFLFVLMISEEVSSQLLPHVILKRRGRHLGILLLEKISEKDLEFFEDYSTGEIISQLNSADFNYNLNIINIITKNIFDIFKFFYLLYLEFKISYILSLYSLIEFILSFLFRKLMTNYNIDIKKITFGISQYFKYLQEFLSNIRIVKSFANEEKEVKRLLELKSLGQLNYFLNLEPIKRFIHECLLNGITLIAGILMLKGHISYGDLIIIQNISQSLSFKLTSLIKIPETYRYFTRKASSYFEIYDYPTKIISIKNLTPNEMKGKITFNKVTFSYPSKPEVNILHNFTLTIQQGETVAIVGESGGGKTTLLFLIQRFYDIKEGHIEIDDIDIKDFNLSWLRRNLGIVEQEPLVFGGSIKENITYGISEYEQMHFDKVCDIANVKTFAEDKTLFPKGYETIIGEKGVKISGGQKQRIAIARALIKQPKILIFDEATSALDAETENDVQKAINNIIKQKHITTIIIAHRLNTVKSADKIFFMSNGKIIEQGTHQQMVKNNGEYKKFIQRQLV